jgi:Cu+-exporting ATPase
LSNSRIKVRIIGMDCASCAKVAEKALEGKEGINSVGVNFLMDTAYVEFDSSKISEVAIKNAIKKAGYDSLVEH